MKFLSRTVVWVVLLGAAFLLSGCMSTIDAVAGLINDMDQAVSESVEEDRQASAAMFGEFASFQNVMLFNVAYFQVFFLGGFDPEYDDFSEGEGVTWEVTGANEGDSSSFIAERALLKRVPEGSWWFLSYSAEDEEMSYEVLLDDEYAPLEILWRDEDTMEVMRYEFDYDDESQEAAEVEEEMPSREEDAVYREGREGDYERSSERVTVGAGTYTAERLKYDYTDPDTGEKVGYTWWVVESVPGNLVKYEYRQVDGGDSATLAGELVSIDRGYRTELGAY